MSCSPRFQIISLFLTFFANYENVECFLSCKIISHNKNYLVKIKFYKKMFDLKELELMFLDPMDLMINNINKLLYRNKAIKFIFF